MGKKNESINISRQRNDKIKRKWTESYRPYHPSQGEPWTEPIDEEVDIRQLYQIQNNEDYTEPNIYCELHLGNQDSVGHNSDIELYDWEVENYETQAKGLLDHLGYIEETNPSMLLSLHHPKNIRKEN